MFLENCGKLALITFNAMVVRSNRTRPTNKYL